MSFFCTQRVCDRVGPALGLANGPLICPRCLGLKYNPLRDWDVSKFPNGYDHHINFRLEVGEHYGVPGVLGHAYENMLNADKKIVPPNRHSKYAVQAASIMFALAFVPTVQVYLTALIESDFDVDFNDEVRAVCFDYFRRFSEHFVVILTAWGITDVNAYFESINLIENPVLRVMCDFSGDVKDWYTENCDIWNRWLVRQQVGGAHIAPADPFYDPSAPAANLVADTQPPVTLEEPWVTYMPIDIESKPFEEEEEKTDLIPNFEGRMSIVPSVEASSPSAVFKWHYKGTPIVNALIEEYGVNVEPDGKTAHPHPTAHLQRLAALMFVLWKCHRDGHTFVDVGSNAMRNVDIIKTFGLNLKFHAMIPVLQAGDEHRYSSAYSYNRGKNKNVTFTMCNHKFERCTCLLKHAVNDGRFQGPPTVVKHAEEPVIYVMFDVLLFVHSIYYITPEDLAMRLTHVRQRRAYVIAHKFAVVGRLCAGEMTYYTNLQGKLLCQVSGNKGGGYMHDDPSWLNAGLTKVDIKVEGSPKTVVLDSRVVKTFGDTLIYEVILSSAPDAELIESIPFYSTSRMDRETFDLISNKVKDGMKETFDATYDVQTLPVRLVEIKVVGQTENKVYITTLQNQDGGRDKVVLPSNMVSSIAMTCAGKIINASLYQTALRRAQLVLSDFVFMPAQLRSLSAVVGAVVGMYSGKLVEANALLAVQESHKGLAAFHTAAINFGEVEAAGCCATTPWAYLLGYGTAPPFDRHKAEEWGTGLHRGIAGNIEGTFPLAKRSLPMNTQLKTPDHALKLSSGAFIDVSKV